MDDFKKVISYSNGIKKMSSNSKGHKESKYILESVMEGTSIISLDDLYLTSLTTFKIIESYKKGSPIYL